LIDDQNKEQSSVRLNETDPEVLLVSSSFEELCLSSSKLDKGMEVKCSDSSHYPLGLAYLHSSLEAGGIPTETLWLNNYSFDHCEEMVMGTLRDKRPPVVGFQIITMNRVSAFRLIEKIHSEMPQVHIVVGGIHATIMHEQLLLRYPFITAVVGEGEITLVELVKAFRSSGDLSSIRGLAFNEGGKVVRTKERELLKDLDSLPPAKHELFMSSGRTSACVITSRGCPFNCSFCCLSSISQRKLRLRSINNVVDEIESLLTEYPQTSQVWIHDDSFFLDNERVIQFCDEILKRGIKTEFVCSGRMKPISREMVRKMEQVNFTKVLLGLESGDESILRGCHKAITQKDVEQAFEMFKDSKINLYAFLIVGLPGENMQTLMETARFVRKLQKIKYAYYHNIGILSVYPGTEVYELEKASKLIDDSYWLTENITPMYLREHTERDLTVYKEILLDWISADRVLTHKGFFKQLNMWPYIVPYLLSNPDIIYPYIKSIGSNSIKSIKNLGEY
jgi:anaerobic magnesium-protoporphyrin IX monomethyl ester cyclase